MYTVRCTMYVWVCHHHSHQFGQTMAHIYHFLKKTLSRQFCINHIDQSYTQPNGIELLLFEIVFFFLSGKFFLPSRGLCAVISRSAIVPSNWTAHLLEFPICYLTKPMRNFITITTTLFTPKTQLNDFAYFFCWFLSPLLLLLLIADIFVRATLVQLIPEIYARCIELGHLELDFYLFDRMLEITLRFLKNEENMVSGSICSDLQQKSMRSATGIWNI